MSQINTLTKEKVIMKNLYFSTAHETSLQVEQLLNKLTQNNKYLIEVSFDQYEHVLEQVKLSSAKQAILNIDIKKGAFTYEQVRHIAEACCLHELRLLESGEIELDTTVLCMSAVIAFAQSKWNGADRQTAIKYAIYTGISIFGEVFAEKVIWKQLGEIEKVNSYVAPSIKTAVVKNGSKVVVEKMATKVTRRAIINSLIAKKTTMLYNADIATGAHVSGILSNVYMARTIMGELSPQQLFKNVMRTAASVTGGIIGMLVFGGIGLQIPSVSTVIISFIGGIIGLILGSVFINKVISKMLDTFIQEDAERMLGIFNEVFVERSRQYLLNEEELQQAIADFNARPQMKVDLRDMYAAEDRVGRAQKIIDLELARIVKHRMYLHIPGDTEIYEVLEHL